MKYLFLSAALLLSGASFAQVNQFHCGTEYSSSWETPEFNQARLPGNSANKSTATYTIPVVIHVVHNGGPENLMLAAVNNGFNSLNNRFANTGTYYNADGVNTDITFCLAQQDKYGNATTGIVYHVDEATDYEQYRTDNGLPSTYPVDSVIKDLYHWPTDKYLNIYVVKNMGQYQTSTATFPNMHGHFMDGMMITYNMLMWEGLAHEAGHYLGLYHTFQPTCTNNDCLNDNDKVCDTPPDMVAEFDPQNCTVNSCTSDEDDASSNNPFRSTTLGGLGDQNDDTKNYMDFSACTMKKFTQGQKDRMQAALTTTRSSLLTSIGCQAPLSAASVEQEQITAYPNPATDYINIKKAGKNSIATLFNTLGQQVKKIEINSDKYLLNTASLQPGIYTLVIINNNGTEKTIRFTRQ